MIIYKDLITGDELFTDAARPKMTEDQSMYVIEGKMRTLKEGNITLAGANPSAEEMTEDLEETCVTGLDFVMDCRLKEMPINTKKDLADYFKGYFRNLVKTLEEKNPGKVEDVKNMAKQKVTEWLPKWKDLSYYLGESENIEGLAALVEWNEDGMSAKAYFFRDGILEQKV